MSRSFSLNQLTEGIRERHLGADTSRLVSKWTRTGLLRGLNENKRETMSRMLENQASQLLREANTLGSGQGGSNIDGFSNIAFPIVRRVFGGLVANELVSIQPMSLPSGLLFYLDYSYGTDVGHSESGLGGNAAPIGATADASVFNQGDSLYGSPAGAGVRAGADAVGGQYDLAGATYSKSYGVTKTGAAAGAASAVDIAAADAGNSGNDSIGAYTAAGTWTSAQIIETTNSKNLKLLQYDPQVIREINEGAHGFHFFLLDCGQLTGLDKTLAKGIGLMATGGAASLDNLVAMNADDSQGVPYQQGGRILNLRRLNQFGLWNATTRTWVPGTASTDTDLLMVVRVAASGTPCSFGSSNLDTDLASDDHYELTYPLADVTNVAGAEGNGSVLTIPSFESGFTGSATGDVAPIIPEIDIKIESIAVTAQTRKLRARWSPELAQDLNAYHSMDAEVELTQILSEQIALEIDREILNDLLVEAKAANYYWSRAPGKFVKKSTGAVASSTIGPNFTGTVREWYETLVETIIDVANEIHRKTLRGAANFIVVSPEVATIFESSVLYKPSIKLDGQGQVGTPFSIGAEAVGSLSNRFTVYKDPYFPRNKILVGYKGGSYLESGYVYAPYVPLIVTPTIFAPEDFTPRKGVMTRYGKKMVRADFYGTVTCLDMDVI